MTDILPPAPPLQLTPEAQRIDVVEHIKQLKREERYASAIELLLREVEAWENGKGVAPWYYEQLAIIYRKQKRPEDEVAILERYERQPKLPGIGPQKLAERLVKARLMAAKVHRV